MKTRIAIVFAALLATTSLFANPALFAKYDAVRQALIADSLQQTQKASSDLATAATAAKQAEIASLATSVSKSADLAKARVAFAALSDKMIALRNASSGARPAVYYCSMEKKSWLQAKGKVGNPYGGKSMVTCGELKAD